MPPNEFVDAATEAAFAECATPEQCKWKALNLACEALRVQAGTYFEFDESAGSLRVEASHGILPWRLAKAPFPVSKGICGWVARERKPAIVNDVASDPRFNQEVDVTTQFKTLAVLCVPVQVAGRLLGVLELVNRHEQPFTEEDGLRLAGIVGAAARRLQVL